MGGFTAYTSPSPSASEDESDDGSGSDDADEEMVLACPMMMRCLLYLLTLCHSWQKKGVVLIWE